MYGYAGANSINSIDPTGDNSIILKLLQILSPVIIGGGGWYTITHPVTVPNTTPMAAPALTPEQVQQKNKEHDAYHDMCDQSPPPELKDPKTKQITNDCDYWTWRNQRDNMCVDMRQQWTDKWDVDDLPSRIKHLTQILNRRVAQCYSRIEMTNACK